ncbi:hypothetical protein AB0O87_11530 [Microbacterium sp. NPDC076768]|uniref:hypothetical protein n=1 Tax=Microbacterium sp. NPDC076768 TaxID=3154858 RepID=UPI003429CA1A
MAVAYEDLADFKGKVYRAAIDCWMADQGFSPPAGAEHTYAKFGWAPFQYHRPDENGNGGGKSVGYGDGVNCEAAMDSVRAAVDRVVDPWLSLPTGTGLGAYKDSANGSSAILGNSRENSPELEDSRAQVASVASGNLKGMFVAPFVDKYCSQLLTVVHGIGDGCVILAASYAAEEELWPAAREDVARLCFQAWEAWTKAAAEAEVANSKAALAVVGAVASGVAAVVTAGAALAATTVTAAAASAAAASGVLGSVGGAASVALAGIDREVAVNGSSFDSILESLSEALEGLSATIAEQDKRLNLMLSQMDDEIYSSRASYDLDYFVLADYPLTDGTMAMDPTSTSLIKQNMTRVHSSMAEAGSALGAEPGSNPSVRPSSIGVSVDGTYTAASSLFSRLRGCLTRSTEEYARGVALFDATVADYFQTEEDAKATVKQLHDAELGVSEVTW